MIVYKSTKQGFQDDIHRGDIDLIIQQAFNEKLHRRVSIKEADSWWNSLHFMANILNDDQIPYNTGVAIECQIPQTSKRIDFILSGKDDNDMENVMIVELKQWKTAELSEKEGIIKTALGKGLHETSHPSYQAWGYAAMLKDFNATIQKEKMNLYPCAYLHNYEEDEVIRNEFYKKHLEKAPVFLKRDSDKLRNFIKRYIKKGDDNNILYRIDQGKIKPSKHLADSLVSLIKGNQEFIMIDEQKVVYETALYLTKKANKGDKQVLIIEGGPGTGKSVVAINLLVEITKREMLTQYVTKNSAPRTVYQSKLTGELTKSRFAALFQGSGSFVNALANEFDALVIDEAHRLNEKSGMFQNLGENQIKEIINASKCSIFFIDEDQKVTLKDIGSKDEIRKWAKKYGAEITELELSSQFRCNGSDAYLSFLDNLLQIRETANVDLGDVEYEFKVCQSPNELKQIIFKKNEKNNSARLVAGYCWDWKSKNNPKLMDIVFPKYNFEMKWNLAVDTMLWIMKPDSVDEIGCIHTCQGLELDYIGVIIGEDLIVRDGMVLVDASKRSNMDSSIKGYKKIFKEDAERANTLAKSIIRNTYRTLMTRGIKGCYVWAVDKETNEWLKNSINS
jgi:DUF2075 family protein/DNA replication protein DnaC